jgi:hypothetical protein
MAPTSIKDFLEKRQVNCNNGFDGYGNCYSSWGSWGRWVALAVIVICFLILGFLCSCYNSRRRRRRGLAPMYGTGWMGGKTPVGQQYGQGGYYSNQPYNGGAAPPYSPPVPNQATGTTFNSNEGYYGQQGYELQQPQSSYQPQRGGDPVYDAPVGPPPKKGDGIIR